MSETDEKRQRQVEYLARFNRTFAGLIPHNLALGLEMVSLDDGEALMRLPYDERLVGNPETGVLHGGVITTLMDSACGAAVFMKLEGPVPIATLDLRIDYLRPAAPGKAVSARAECFKMTRNVAFVRGVAFHDDENDPIASAAGSFMVSTKVGKPGKVIKDKAKQAEEGGPS